MSAAYEEMDDERLIRHLRAIRHEDGFLNLPAIGEALSRLLSRKSETVYKTISPLSHHLPFYQPKPINPRRTIGDPPLNPRPH